MRVGGPLLAHAKASRTLTSLTSVMMSILAIAGFIYRPQGRGVFGLTLASPGMFMLYVLNSWLLIEHAH